MTYIESKDIIRRRLSSRPTLLVFEVLGRISKCAIEDMAKQIDQAFDLYDKIDILLIMTQFDGMDVGAVFDKEAFGAQVRSVGHVHKYGVVGAPIWARAMIEFSDFFLPVDAKTFNLEEEADAWAWVDARPEATITGKP